MSVPSHPVSIILRTPQTIEICHGLLQTSVDFSLKGRLANRPVIGKIAENELFLWKRLSYSNPFQPVMRIELVGILERTEIRCTKEIRPIVRGFYRIWLLFIASSSVLIFVGLLGRTVNRDAWIGLAIALSVLGCAYAQFRFCSFLARDEEEFIIDFLRTTLNAV